MALEEDIFWVGSNGATGPKHEKQFLNFWEEKGDGYGYRFEASKPWYSGCRCGSLVDRPANAYVGGKWLR